MEITLLWRRETDRHNAVHYLLTYVFMCLVRNLYV